MPASQFVTCPKCGRLLLATDNATQPHTCTKEA